MGRVLGLGGLLGGPPPALVLAVPLDGGREAPGEVGVGGPPAELAAELGGVDRVAAVVAGSVAHPVEGVGRLAHRAQDVAHDGDVVPLAVGADEVGLAGDAAGEDRPHGRAVVRGVDPVPHVPAVAVELRADAAEHVGDLARDELLHVLVGAVVVGAVRDGGGHAVGAVPGAHEHVAGGKHNVHGWTGMPHFREDGESPCERGEFRFVLVDYARRQQMGNSPPREWGTTIVNL